MNETQRELLEVGNAERALDLLEAVTKSAPTEPSIWLTKAAALHQLNRLTRKWRRSIGR